MTVRETLSLVMWLLLAFIVILGSLMYSSQRQQRERCEHRTPHTYLYDYYHCGETK